jgi:hypothetical protein
MDFREWHRLLPRADQENNLLNLPRLAADKSGSHLADILCNFDFIEAKILACGIDELLADYAMAGQLPEERKCDPAIAAIGDVIRLVSRHLGADPYELPSHLWARLQDIDSTYTQKLLEQARKPNRDRPLGWLRPTSQTWTPPGTAMEIERELWNCRSISSLLM